MKEEPIKKFFVSVLVVVAVLSFIPFPNISQKDITISQGQTEKPIPLFIGQVTVKALIADTGPLRQRGLGGRDGILSDEAMFFVFDNSALHGIWMKDMMFPIDIFWVDETMRVISIKEGVSPSSYPEVFTPISPAKYVLETGAGFAERNQVKIGDEISF